MGEIGVVDAGDQQTERVGTAGAQPFGQQAGRVVAAFGLARDERDGLLADTVFGGLSAQYAGDGRNRKAGALRDADEGLFRDKVRKICEKQGRDFVFLLFVFTFAELAQTFALKLDGCFAG